MTDGLLDTTFFVDLWRGHHAGAAALWARIKSGEWTASYCALTILELWKGRSITREEETFHDAVMALLTEVSVSGAAAKQAGLWLRPMTDEASRRLLGDALIAAVAKELALPVMTTNRRDFARFPSLY